MSGVLDSKSLGDPAAFGTREDLEAAWRAMAPAPRDLGRVSRLIRRASHGQREVLASCSLALGVGMEGDKWARQSTRKPGEEIAVMQWGVAQIIAQGQPVELAGDQLYLDLDLSASNLPVGARVRVGAAELEVSPVAHMGCSKFAGRFGKAALAWTLERALRPLRLRGLYLIVRSGGRVKLGDAVQVLSRPT